MNIKAVNYSRTRFGVWKQNKTTDFQRSIRSSGEVQENCEQGNILPYEEKTEEIVAYGTLYKYIKRVIYLPL